MVVSSGGLGPTGDDLTRESLARAVDRDLVSDPASLAAIEEFFSRRGLPMTHNNQRQAFIPRGARAIPNPVGTAPGILWSSSSKTVVCLPGPPGEWMAMFEAIRPSLARTAAQAGVPGQKQASFYVVGLGESRLEAMLSCISLPEGTGFATYCSPGQVRVTVVSDKGQYGSRDIDESVARLMRCLGEHVVRPLGKDLAGSLACRLSGAGLSLSSGESCTGGLIGHLLTEVPGSSRFFMGGVIAYDNRVKEMALGVDRALIESLGAVSPEVASSMARGVRSALGTDLGVGITGIAGPGGAAPGKPVGTCFVAISGPGHTRQGTVRGGTDRAANKLYFARAALTHLHFFLKEAGI